MMTAGASYCICTTGGVNPECRYHRRSSEPCMDRLAGVRCTNDEGHTARGEPHSGYDAREEMTIQW